VNQLTKKVYVGQFRGHDVTVINGTTDKIIATIPVAYDPLDVAVNQVTNTAYATGKTAVSVINGMTNQVSATVGVRGLGIAVDVNTDTIYDVTASSSPSEPGPVAVINGESNMVTANFTVRTPSGIAVDLNGDTIYVDSFWHAQLVVVDGTTNTVIATVHVGSLPSNVAVDPRTGLVYVTNQGDSTVSVVGS
jgi:YVTN family beta-propeller protein